jgi:hypothetical protein
MEEDREEVAVMKSQLTWFAAGMAAMAGVFLLLGGGLASTLPLLLLLACPLMMFVMMRGMGDTHGQGSHEHRHESQ